MSVVPATFTSAQPAGWRKARTGEDTLFSPFYPIKGGSTPPDASIEPPAATPNGAQSPAPSPASFQHGATGERTFTAADIEKARKEEKDKLYSQIVALQTEQNKASETLAAIQKEREEAAAELVRQQQTKDAAVQAAKEEDMSAKQLLEQKLKEANESWQEKFARLEEERQAERTLADKERQYNALVDFRNNAITAAGDDIAPQFHSFITGETEAQITASIAAAKTATESLAQSFANVQQQQRSQMRGVAPTGYAPIGPMDNNSGTKTYTAEDINNMSMSEYAEFRSKSGLAAGEAQRNRGLFS